MTGPTLSNNNPFTYPAGTGRTDPTDVLTFDGGAEASWKDLTLWCTALRINRASAVARHRYPNVPGQTIEPMGREPIEVELETSWFGSDWRDRLENLAYTKDNEQSSGLLVLPDGRGQFNAFCVEMSEDVDLTMDGATVTLRLEEDAHESAYMVFVSEDDLSSAAADVQTEDAETVGPALSRYNSFVTATDAPPTREVYAALTALEVTVATARAACDTLTTAGIDRYLALGRIQWRARRAFPDQDFLIAALG